MSSTAKARFLESYKHEHATTRRVLGAYPAEQQDLKPHERSNSALKLAWTFVIEEQLMLKSLKGEQVLGGGFPAPPATWAEVLDAFDKTHTEVVREAENPTDAELPGTTTFFTAPKQTGPIPRENFLMFILHDQIHHRGQLSVYLRMAGGKVPSIYGPSADEPWS